MPSPSKKRKLDSSSKSAAPAKGLEYFFNRQKQVASRSKLGNETTELTDEELARKLQDEWNRQDDPGGPSSKALEGAGHDEQPTKEPSSSKDVLSQGSSRDASEQPPIAPSTGGPSLGSPKKTLTLQSAGMSEDVVTSTIPLDESPLSFDPAAYTPQLQSLWASEGGDAAYSLLTRCFMLVSGTTSRIKIVDTLVNCLRILIEADPSSLLPAVSLFL